jgi:hypothetical protein
MTKYLEAKTFMIFQQLIYQNYVADNINYKKYCEIYTEWFEKTFGHVTIPSKFYLFLDKDDNSDDIRPCINDTMQTYFNIEGNLNTLKNMELNPCIFLYDWISEFSSNIRVNLKTYEIKTEGLTNKFYLNPNYFSVSYAVTFEDIPKTNIKLL